MKIVNEYIKFARLTRTTSFDLHYRSDRIGRKDTSLRARYVIVRRLGRDHFVEYFSSLSFKVGSAQTLASEGATLPEQESVGPWKSSNMPAHCCRKPFAERNGIVKYIYR